MQARQAKTRPESHQMSPQLFECPNCKRTFLARTNRRRPSYAGRCGACGTPLIAGGEKEAEVQERLYGRRLAPTRATPAAGWEEGDGPP